MSIGHQAYQQLVQGAGLINDPEVQLYMDRLVSRIVTTTPGPNLQYRVVVLNAPDTVNAVTPPGYVVVYSGLIAKVESEAELAAVLAHEIAHNYAHHQVRQLAKSAYAQAAVNGLMSALQRKNAAVQAISGIGANMAAGLFLKAYSRYEEEEADLYGTHLMFNAGWNPAAMATFFDRLHQDRPRQPFKLTSTHPSDPERVNYVFAYIQGFPINGQMQPDSDAFHAVKRRLGFERGTDFVSVPGPSGGAPGPPGPGGPGPSTEEAHRLRLRILLFPTALNQCRARQ